MKATQIDKSITRAMWLAVLSVGSPVYPLGYLDYQEYTHSLHPYGRGKKKVEPKEITDFSICDFHQYPENKSYWSYYGGYPQASEIMAQKFIEDIPIGIDWEATQEPKDDVEHEFNSSFDPSTEIPVMQGVLVMNNGNKYPWIANFETDMQNLRSLLSFIKEWESKTDEEILELVKERINRSLENKRLYGFSAYMHYLGQGRDI